MIPKKRLFHPPKLWNAIGTGIGTLTPTIPILQLVVKCPQASPSDV